MNIKRYDPYCLSSQGNRMQALMREEKDGDWCAFVEYEKARTALEDITFAMTDPDRIPDDVADKVFKIAYTALNGKYEKQ